MRDNLAVDHAALDGFADVTAKILRGEVDRKMGPLSADVIQIRKDFDAHVGEVGVLDGRVGALEARATADTQYTNRFIDKIEAIEARVARLDAVEADLKSAAEALEDLRGKFDRQQGDLESTRQQGSALEERLSASDLAQKAQTDRIDKGEAAIEALMQADTQTNVRIGEVKQAIEAVKAETGEATGHILAEIEARDVGLSAQVDAISDGLSKLPALVERVVAVEAIQLSTAEGIGDVQMAIKALKDADAETLSIAQRAIELMDRDVDDKLKAFGDHLDKVEDLHKSVAQAAETVEDVAVAANRMAQEARQGHEANLAAIQGLSAQVEALAARPEPVGIARTFIDHDGMLLITKTNGDIEVPGPVKGKDGQDGQPGKDGQDGTSPPPLEIDNLDVTLADDDRTLVFAFNDKIERRVECPWPVPRGTFKEGEVYKSGDWVTWGGSQWEAQAETSARPAEGGDWLLKVKRGRDGKGAPN